MIVYFNKVKLDRTSFLLTKRLAWAPVTRTERGIKDNFSRFLLKRILPRIGRFLLSSYGKSVSSFWSFIQAGWSFNTAFEQNKASLPSGLGTLCCAAKKRINYSSSGVLPHLRRNSCPYSWIHLLHTERKEYASFVNIRHRNWGTHCMTTGLLTPNSHQTAKGATFITWPSPYYRTPTGYSNNSNN